MNKLRNLVHALRASRCALPLSALAALLILLTSESGFQTATGAVDYLSRQANARLATQLLQRNLIDAETGQRGYLITGRGEYLASYRAASSQAETSLASLSRCYALDPVAAALVAQIKKSAGQKMAELAETIALHDQGQEQAWRDLVSSGVGKQQMDELRKLTESLLKIESGRVAAGRVKLYRTLMVNRNGVIALAAISLLALFMHLRQTRALVRQRGQQRLAAETERERLEHEVKHRTDQLTELARHLQTAREDERSRLARELHDELGALLTGAKLDLARLRKRIGDAPIELAQRLQSLESGLNSGIALKRRIIEDLSPSTLANLGLVAALEILLREWRERSGVEVHSALEPVRLTASAELTLFRLVQEALTNIGKYAAANRVEVELTARNQRVLVRVRDDGAGFDTGRQPISAHGLLGMKYRLESEGGELVVDSSLGSGTTLSAILPEPAEPEPPQAPAGAAEAPLATGAAA